MDVVFSANNFQEMVKLPIIPPDFAVPSPWNNSEFETIQMGAINLIGLRGLKTLSIQSFFPVDGQKYKFAKDRKSGQAYVNFFNRWANRRLPIRIIVSDNESAEILNMACTVENFTTGRDRAGDIPYTLDLKEFRFAAVQ